MPHANPSRLILAVTLMLVHAAVAAAHEGHDLAALAVAAVSEHADEANAARDHLRLHGQPGLDALLTHHADLLTWSPATSEPEPAARQRLRAAIDHVARQRDAHASRLYWHTDLAAALDTAKAQGKPVLSLHLLGRLDEEYSCANSRFFRTALYANQSINDHLREHYVLHWHTVRPAPRITIDMGDGRRIERTITGNSIHYVLAPDGQVIDAIPGLYGPQAFHRRLQEAHGRQQIYTNGFHGRPGSNNAIGAALQSLEQTYAMQTRQLSARPRAADARLEPLPDLDDMPSVSSEVLSPTSSTAQISTVNRTISLTAPRITFFGGKRFVEEPMLNAMDLSGLDLLPPRPRAADVSPAPEPDDTPITAPELQLNEVRDTVPVLERGVLMLGGKRRVEESTLNAMDLAAIDLLDDGDARWQQLGDAFYLDASRLDDASLALMREKLAREPDVSPAGDSTWQSLGGQVDFDAMVEQFERSMATDTARNQFLLRRTILTWLRDAVEPVDLATLNRRVYDELFLQPESDSWLGLVPEAAYSGLDGEGLVRQAASE